MREALLAAVIVVAAAPPSRAQTCQELSDRYAIVHGQSHGMAPLDVVLTWQSRGCQTRPSAARAGPLCQELSDTFGIIHGVTHGRAPVDAKSAWAALGCNRTPSCQALSDLFGMTPSNPGTATAQHVASFQKRSCATSPSAARLPSLCDELADQFAVPRDGSVPADLPLWGSLGCAALPPPTAVDTRYGFRNAARTGLARLSSTSSGGAAARAIDGNTNGLWGGNSVVSTTKQVGAWLEVDLREAVPVAALDIYPRTDCCPERSTGLIAELSLDPCDVPQRRVVETAAVPASGDVRRVDLPRLASARFVCVRHPSDAPSNFINLAEVEAFVPLRGTDNLARLALATQSSTGYGGDARRANDGIASGVWGHASISHSSSDSLGNPNDTAPWLQLDLRDVRRVGEVVVHNRTDCCDDRLAGARVELSLDPCSDPFRRTTATEWLPVYDITATGRIRDNGLPEFTARVAPVVSLPFVDAPEARFVCVRHAEPRFLSVAEVQVFPGRGRVDLARDAVAEQSSTAFEAFAGRVIDGSNDGVFENGSVNHTDPDKPGPHWVQLDLGAPHEVASLVVHNRTDDCALLQDGAPNPARGCNENLAYAELELTNAPCDVETRPIVAKATLVPPPSAQYFFAGIGRRFAFDLPAGSTGRYVCLRHTKALHVAALHAFGAEVSAPPAVPAPVVALAATSAVPASAAGVSLPTAAGSAESFTFEVLVAGVMPLTCSAVRAGAQYTMRCGDLGALAMEGQFTSPADFRLRSVDTFAFTDLAGRWFPTALAQGLDLLSALALRDVRIVMSSARGVSVEAYVTLANPGGSSALASALKNASRFLDNHVPGYQREPKVEVFASVLNHELQVVTRLEVITTCAGPSRVDTLGAGLKFESGALVGRIRLSATALPALGFGLEGSAFIKPTDRDPWLRFTPAIELGVAPDASAITVKGAISGACDPDCAEACGCTASQCRGDWHPLGLGAVALQNGYVEVGASTVAGQPVPVITMAFDRARVGSMTGRYAISLNYPQKQVAFELAANRLPLVGALGVVGLAGVDLPDALSLEDPILSFATAKTRVFNTEIPAGIRLGGGLELPALGIRGRLAANLTAAGLVDVTDLGRGLKLSPPTGSFSLALDVAGLIDKILSVPGLGGLVGDVLKRTLWVTRLELGAIVGSTVGLSAKVSLRVLGKAHNVSVNPSVALDPRQLARALADELEALLAGEPFAAIYGAVSQAFTQAAQEVAAQLAQGGKVIVNGVATAASKVFKTSQEAAKEAREALERAYNWLKKICSFCP